MKEKKILFLINTLSGGGAEKVLVDIVNNLDKDKFKITLKTVVDSGVHKNYLKNHICYESIIKTKNLFLRKIFNYLINFVIPPKLVYKLFIKSDYDYEVAFLEGIPTKILSYSTNKKAKKYAWVHTDMYVNFAGHQKIYKNFNDYIACYKRFDKIFCVSKGVKDGFIKRFNIEDNVFVVYNPYDDEKIKKMSEEKQTEIVSDKFRIITVGRLCEQKGYERLLKIHKRLISEGHNYHLYILGEGDKRVTLEKYISDNNLENSVTLLGFKDNPYKYVKACDLFVCSSFAEGFSTAVAESIILGIPVVSTNVAGAKEILGDSEYGIVVDNSEVALYDGLVKIITDENLMKFYKKKSLERTENFKLEKTMSEIEELFI